LNANICTAEQISARISALPARERFENSTLAPKDRTVNSPSCRKQLMAVRLPCSRSLTGRACVSSSPDSGVRSDRKVPRRTEWDYRNIPTECAKGHDGIARLSDENTVESLFLGFGAPVSFRPFLDRVQTALNNQYPRSFGLSRRRAGLNPSSWAPRCPVSN
jgi:hypothetical protein